MEHCFSSGRLINQMTWLHTVNEDGEEPLTIWYSAFVTLMSLQFSLAAQWGGGWEEIHCHVKSIEVAHAGLCCWMPMIPRNSVSRATLRSHCPNYSTKGQRACRFSCQPSSSTPDLTYLINWSQSSESWLVKLCALDWLEQKPAATRLFVE